MEETHTPRLRPDHIPFIYTVKLACVCKHAVLLYPSSGLDTPAGLCIVYPPQMPKRALQ